MTVLSALAAACLLLGLLSAAACLRRLRRRRIVRAGGHAGACTALLALAAALGGIALNLHTYQRLTFERPVAQLQFRALGPQHYRVTLLRADTGSGHAYELRGDQWQLDARVLKMHGLANLLGLDSRYRLERLSGRYAEVDAERSRPRSVYPLADTRGLELWRLAQRHGEWLPGVEAYYGSATYLPMRDRAEFTVSISQSGLVARPDNDAARQAVRNWR